MIKKPYFCKPLHEEKTKLYKQKWIELRNKYPKHGRAELSTFNRAAYAWLSKYERVWLEDNSPISLRKNRVERIKFKKGIWNF